MLLSLLSLLINIVIGKIKGIFLVDDALSTISGLLLAMIFMMSFLFPILFKFGAEKGRIAMLSIGLGIFGIVMLFTKIVKLEISDNLISLYFPILFIISSILMVTISYLISKKIYLKREF